MRIGVRVLVSLNAGVLFEQAADHESGYKTWNILDNIAPDTATVEASNVKDTSFTLNATGHDNEGVAKYKFYLYDENNEEIYVKEIESTNGTEVWNVTSSEIGKEITANTTYKAKVIVYDKAGNDLESSTIEFKTKAAIQAAALAVNVGDFVDYDAGIWIQEDLNKIMSSPSSGSTTVSVNNSSSLPTTQGQFGGFTTGQSRNTNSTPSSSEYTSDYSGWRVWSVDGDTVTLISAGHPETYYQEYQNLMPGDEQLNYAKDSMNVLRNRDCSMYANQYAIKEGENKPHILTGEEAVEWYNYHYDPDYTLVNYGMANESSWFQQTFPTTGVIDVLANGSFYLFATAYSETAMYTMSPALRYVSYLIGYGRAMGVRVLVTLNSDVLVKQGSDHESGYKTWNIVDTIAPDTATLASSNVKETSFTLTATGSDNIGVTKYEFYINGSLANTIDSTEGSVSWNVTGKTTGETYTCKVRVYDAAGNWKDSDEISVTPSAGVKLASVVEVGDFVDYDAGIWTQEDLDKIENSTGSPTVNNSSSLPDEQGEFGGFTTGQSRNTNSTSYDSNYTPDYSGWRVWDVDGDTVTLISAGHTESYMHDAENDNGLVSESILQNRDCSMYVNNYAMDAQFLKVSDAVSWYNAQFGSDYTVDSFTHFGYWDELEDTIVESGDGYVTWTGSEKNISLLDNGSYYYFASSARVGSMSAVISMWGLFPNENYISRGALRAYNYQSGAYGLRVLVTLKSDVMTPEDGEYGSQGNPWKIKGQDPTPTPWTGGVATAFASGTGTETDPYMIETAEQLAYLASSTNSGTTYDGKYIALGADIDLGGVQAADGSWSGQQWTPIGTSSNEFGGNFNGNGYSISNLYVCENTNSIGDLALFGHIVGGASNDNPTYIQNLIISSGHLESTENSVASLAGSVRGATVICNVINCADVSSREWYQDAAGIILYAEGNSCIDGNPVLDNLYNYGSVSTGMRVGGCVSASSHVYFGTLVNYGEISNGNYVGGCVGNPYGCPEHTRPNTSNMKNFGKIDGIVNENCLVGFEEVDDECWET